ncbi:MAG: branched-chain amino acid ABC transporter permease [Actinomycetota bacterium]|jgi:branched-chain amino acid transport system permease protein|nr:branched-chain amino acid ABC transporter permease [Actinomycetota bacterium]
MPPHDLLPDGNRRGRRWAKLASLIVLITLLAVVPPAMNSYDQYLITLTLVYAITTLGLNVLIGWTGQLSLAHAGVFGLGAYLSTILIQHGWGFVPSLLVAGLGSAIVGGLVVFPALRFSGFTLAVASLAFASVIVQLFDNGGSVTGGGGGLAVPVFQFSGLSQTMSTYYVTLISTVLCFVVAHRMRHLRFGRVAFSIRDTEIAAVVSGIRVVRYKVFVFAFAAFLGAIGGALYAQLETFIFPVMFSTNTLVLMLVMLFLGGASSLYGPIFGAIFAVVMVELLQSFGSYQDLLYGLLLMLVIGVLPGGMASLPERLRTSHLLGRAVRGVASRFGRGRQDEATAASPVPPTATGSSLVDDPGDGVESGVA